VNVSQGVEVERPTSLGNSLQVTTQRETLLAFDTPHTWQA